MSFPMVISIYSYDMWFVICFESKGSVGYSMHFIWEIIMSGPWWCHRFIRTPLAGTRVANVSRPIISNTLGTMLPTLFMSRYIFTLKPTVICHCCLLGDLCSSSHTISHWWIKRVGVFCVLCMALWWCWSVWCVCVEAIQNTWLFSPFK